MTVSGAIQRDVTVADQFDLFYSQTFDEDVVHPRAYVFAPDACKSYSGSDQIVAMNPRRSASQIDGFANLLAEAVGEGVDPTGKHTGDLLIAEVGGLRYPVRDGIPVMLVEEAKLPEGIESLEAFKVRFKDQIPQ